ncbi:Imm70 family immunity protein [Amantichitinum ursilacus]|uniref:Imm70 family immunity protein n=1 Tax=Amantichitinum ursilacus TaxID=857265 RepID=UPI0006B47E87|nr:Imm70 family immunity protein [Amantichitinum ursilacus]
MGLYLCIFDEDEEIDGVGVGRYTDFNALRQYIANKLEGTIVGSKYPLFSLHSDSDGEWSAKDCPALARELKDIIDLMNKLPPSAFPSDWQEALAKSYGIAPENAFESFLDVDGEFVLERIFRLAELAAEKAKPILFQ